MKKLKSLILVEVQFSLLLWYKSKSFFFNMSILSPLRKGCGLSFGSGEKDKNVKNSRQQGRSQNFYQKISSGDLKKSNLLLKLNKILIDNFLFSTN